MFSTKCFKLSVKQFTKKHTVLASFHAVATKLSCCLCSASPLPINCGFLSSFGNPFLFHIIVPQAYIPLLSRFWSKGTDVKNLQYIKL